MPTDPPEQTAARQWELRARQLQRERNLLTAVLLLVLLLALLERIGSRVWAIAVFDSARREFVEVAYLPQRAQAEQVLSTLQENARRRHPFYRDAPKEFLAARPSFREAVVLRRVRRVVALPRQATGADLPVQRAAEALASVLHVQVKASSLNDVENRKVLVVLPAETMVEDASKARLANVSGRVSRDLTGGDRLIEARFLQKTAVQPVSWPLEEVRTVQQAVEYLTSGAAPAMHVVQAGERPSQIAAKYNATGEDLARWNPGRDFSLLRVGDRLVVRRPEPPLTVLTVERRSYKQRIDGHWYQVTVEIRRHDGEEKNRSELERKLLK
ncbi:MAG: LysM peptidoglycan-binding domain-containing protein [Fimbriimonadaceae bacterium]|nr:LysM peptidoglycan-binding domain-containing protein [Fimbriimonadaceae bacterium]